MNFREIALQIPLSSAVVHSYKFTLMAKIIKPFLILFGPDFKTIAKRKYHEKIK